MNIYEFIYQRYNSFFYLEKKDQILSLIKNCVFAYLDGNKKYTCGCYFLLYFKKYGLKKCVGHVLEFNTIIDINSESLSPDFNINEIIIDEDSLFSNNARNFVKEKCKELLNEMKRKYIGDNFSFDCTITNFMTNNQYTIINKDDIYISV